QTFPICFQDFWREKVARFIKMKVHADILPIYSLQSYSQISAFVHVINLYNQKNLRKFDLNATHLVTDELIPDGMGGYITPRGDKYWFGITPVVGASWEF
ncbi:MAG: hypothetical protein ACKVUS_11850, partial [Saprospiraceae bacterium]